MNKRELESSLETYFRRRIQLVGGYTIKLAPTEAGLPDRMVFFPGGRICLVELKANDGRISPIQKVVHDRLWRRYGVRVATLTGREEVVNWIRIQMNAFGPKNYRDTFNTSA